MSWRFHPKWPHADPCNLTCNFFGIPPWSLRPNTNNSIKHSVSNSPHTVVDTKYSTIVWITSMGSFISQDSHWTFLVQTEIFTKLYRHFKAGHNLIPSSIGPNELIQTLVTPRRFVRLNEAIYRRWDFDARTRYLAQTPARTEKSNATLCHAPLRPLVLPPPPTYPAPATVKSVAGFGDPFNQTRHV